MQISDCNTFMIYPDDRQPSTNSSTLADEFYMTSPQADEREADRGEICVSNQKPEPTGCGLYLWADMINHSCDPNCEWTYQRGNVRIKTLRDIQAHEELTISYIPTDLSLADRLSKLASYGFECRCSSCLSDMKASRSACRPAEVETKVSNVE